MKNRSKILLVILLVLALAVVLLYLATKSQVAPSPTNPGQSATGNGTTTVPVTSVDPKTLNWTTFANEQGNVRFSYPTDWKLATLSAKPETYTLGSSEYTPVMSGMVALSEVYVSVYENPSNLSAKDYFANFDDTSRLWFDKLPYSTTQIDGRPAYMFASTDLTGRSDTNTEYVVSCADRIVTLSFNHENRRDADVVETIANSIKCE